MLHGKLPTSSCRHATWWISDTSGGNSVPGEAEHHKPNRMSCRNELSGWYADTGERQGRSKRSLMRPSDASGSLMKNASRCRPLLRCRTPPTQWCMELHYARVAPAKCQSVASESKGHVTPLTDGPHLSQSGGRQTNQTNKQNKQPHCALHSYSECLSWLTTTEHLFLFQAAFTFQTLSRFDSHLDCLVM